MEAFVTDHLAEARAAVGETFILLHPPLPLLGVSTAMERERQQHDSLAAKGADMANKVSRRSLSIAIDTL